ncbi:MAG: hypothetical protein AAF098_09665, partial [Pseudomonadota bacterium]
VFDGSTGPLGRPVSLFTFALEQRFFSATPNFSQVISIVLHCCNSVLVYAVLVLVLRSYDNDDRLFWAVLGALLWACAPQKVSTVLYIVQRMTMLSTFFTLLALWTYLKARTTANLHKSSAYFVVCLLTLAAAPFAKENGVLAVPIIASAELYLLSDNRTGFDSARLKAIAATMLSTGVFAFLVLGVVEWNHSVDSYSQRNFDFWDRIVAIPTVLLDYVRQFFLPNTRSMGLLHDDWPILGSGLSPLAPIFAAFGLLAITITPLLALKNTRLSLAGFGCSVFLIGHSIESFFLPLELYFEHRNYLPSLGLIVVAAEVIRAIQSRIQPISTKPVYAVLVIYLLLCVSSATMLASWWRSSGLLLQHHLTGHPDSTRANTEIAFAQANSGDLDTAIRSLERAADLSIRQPAARSMGAADTVLLRNALVCMSGSDDFEMTSPEIVGPAKNAVRTVVFRVYTTLYKDKVCVDAPWRELSIWFMRLSLLFNERGVPWNVPTLVDLALFEQARGNAVGTFTYSAMILEQRPKQATALLLLARASEFLGDQETFDDAVSRLRALDREGVLDQLDRYVLAKLVKRNT